MICVPRAAACVVAILAALAMTGPVRAVSVLTLSEFSSDETPAARLTGTLTFTVAGDVLSLAVANDTEVPLDYYINQVYFSATSNVTGFGSTNLPSDWTVVFRENDEHAGGFGYFDVQLSTNKRAAQVGPGEALTFTFDLAGTAPFADIDFATELSDRGHPAALGAAKFVRGPCDDSAFGSAYIVGTPPTPVDLTVPEPLTLTACLVGFAAVALGVRRRVRA
jgi:hypothetical protein